MVCWDVVTPADAVVSEGVDDVIKALVVVGGGLVSVKELVSVKLGVVSLAAMSVASVKAGESGPWKKSVLVVVAEPRTVPGRVPWEELLLGKGACLGACFGRCGSWRPSVLPN